MIEITKNGNVTVILFTDSDYYLFNSGQIIAPLGSLTMVVDKSDMVTFRKAANNDLLFSAKLGKIKVNGTTLTKQNAQTLFDAAMGGSNSAGLRFEEVEELPATGENGVIYLVPNGDDTFTEWVWIDNEETYEKLGYDVDLSNYYTKSEVNNISGLVNYYDKDTIDEGNLTVSAALNELHEDTLTLTTALNGKQNTLTFDNAPTQSSTNPVTSGGVYTALSGKQDTLTFDTTPTENSTNPVTSGGIVAYLLNNYYNNQWVDMHLQELEENVNDVNRVVATALNRLNSGKQDVLTFDTAPTNASTNPVTSGGVYTALSGKQDTLTFDNAPTQNSTNPVTSGGLYVVLGDIDTALTTIIGSNS